MKANNFSVIIPLYNKRDYIVRAIESVLSQTYVRFEVIVVDDGSTDDGLWQVENLANSRLKIVRQRNMGVSSARNIGVENSEYDFVVFLDADDVWEMDLLAQLNTLINFRP